MTQSLKKSAINAILFQVGWFACVFGGNKVALIVTALMVIIHLWFITDWKKERELLTATLLLGSAVDSFLGQTGILIFDNDNLLLPLWLSCLWLLFGTTLRHCLAWTGRYRLAGVVTGAIAGPASYYAGSKLSDVDLAQPLWQPLLVLSVVWAIMIPLLQNFSAMWLKRYRRNYPQ